MPNIEVISAAGFADRVVTREPEKVKSEVVFLSPLDISFSQSVVYPKFTDGKSVDDAVKQIHETGGVGAEDDVVLEPPFPMIEAVRWSPKLRDGEGKPVLDEKGDNRLGSEGLFTVDNRRLYALQRAAVARYPRKCRVAVGVVTDKTEIMRHLKKFRTRTNGMSISVSEWNGVGRDNAKEFSVLRIWDWRSAIASIEQGGTDIVAADVADKGSIECWEYLDNQDVRRGPFSNWQMLQWWESKMLPPNLRIRPYDAAVAAERSSPDDGNEGFVLAAAFFQDAPTPFATGFAPKATDAQATWQKCMECGRNRWEGSSAYGNWYCANCWRKWKREDG